MNTKTSKILAVLATLLSLFGAANWGDLLQVLPETWAKPVTYIPTAVAMIVHLVDLLDNGKVDGSFRVKLHPVTMFLAGLIAAVALSSCSTRTIVAPDGTTTQIEEVDADAITTWLDRILQAGAAAKKVTPVEQIGRAHV